MKRWLYVTIVSLLITAGCNNEKQSVQDAGELSMHLTEVQFDTTFYDFGRVVSGEKVTYTYKFMNVGDAPLVITDAYSSCGCTVPEYTSDPVKSGGEGRVEVLFDSSGRRGMQYKSVVIKLNTAYGQKNLAFRANVVEK